MKSKDEEIIDEIKNIIKEIKTNAACIKEYGQDLAENSIGTWSQLDKLQGIVNAAYEIEEACLKVVGDE